MILLCKVTILMSLAVVGGMGLACANGALIKCRRNDINIRAYWNTIIPTQKSLILKNYGAPSYPAGGEHPPKPH